MKNFKKTHKNIELQIQIRRFKRKYFTSAKKKEENKRQVLEALSKCFNVEPAVYFKGQPH